jgi:hypothetical protein
LDSLAKLENEMLEVYKKNLDVRIFLLNIDFTVLKSHDYFDQSEFIDFIKYKEEHRVFVQLQIISKIKMMIEDFAVLSMSFIGKCNFYEILTSKEDMGPKIGEFIQKLADVKYDMIFEIMSWIRVENLGDTKINSIDFDLMCKYIGAQAAILQQQLEKIADFSNYHHPAFKRFKHGGMPIFTNFRINSNFESISLVSKEKDFFNDLSLIPYHNSFFKMYMQFAYDLGDIILEMIENKQRCNTHNIAGVFPKTSYAGSSSVRDIIRRYNIRYPLLTTLVTSYEASRIEKLLETVPQFYTQAFS